MAVVKDNTLDDWVEGQPWLGEFGDGTLDTWTEGQPDIMLDFLTEPPEPTASKQPMIWIRM